MLDSQLSITLVKGEADPPRPDPDQRAVSCPLSAEGEVRTMRRDELERLADYYDTHSTAEEMEGGRVEVEPVERPMVSTSLRLPKPIMDAIRAAAARRGVRPTALMREWVEARVAAEESGDEEARMTRAVMERLPRVIAEAYADAHRKSA